MARQSMNTRQRLEAYHPEFDSDVLDTVAEAADRQSDFDTPQEFFAAMGVGEPEVFYGKGAKPTSIVDIQPDEYDPRHALWVHLPMANSTDPNQRFQLANLAATNPNTRIIGIGNPSGIGDGTGRLSLANAWHVARGERLHTLVEAGHRYAEVHGIAVADETGFSYGALKTILSAQSATYDVRHVVAIEPVIGPRPLWQLKADFEASLEHLQEYVDAAESPVYEAARALCNSGLRADAAFLRATNLAIAGALSKVDFEHEALRTLAVCKNMDLTVVSGTNSELCDGLGVLSAHPRVLSIELLGQHHPLANDPALHAALVLQGTRA